MNVFGLRFLEPMGSVEEVDQTNWTWRPASTGALKIYASGNSTRSRESTYAAETDNRQDEDRPNEGLAA
jgi:hypothetical protein